MLLFATFSEQSTLMPSKYTLYINVTTVITYLFT
jgi:hypothetical protein